MIIEELIPCISLFGLGLLLFKFLSKKEFNFLVSEKIIYCLILFSAIIIIPWAFFGLHKITILFQLWPLILALIGLSYVGILLYHYFKKLIISLEQTNNIKYILRSKFTHLSISNQMVIFFSITILLLVFYSIFNLIMSFRDFDAIWMYIPDAMWYYRTNYIPAINPLNFRVSTKEPFVSLLFSYSLYTTGSLNIKLFPLLFVLGWLLTVYVFIIKIWGDKPKALMGTVFFIVSPFMYYIFTFWVYYQEIYISFFYAVTLLCIFNYLQLSDNPELSNTQEVRYFYLFLGILSFALSLLAKLSGWSLLFVILVVYPFPKKDRIIQSLGICLITLFLFVKASTDFYIGIGFVLVLFCLCLLYLTWKKTTKDQPSFYQKKNSPLFGLIILPAGVILGGFWLYDTLQRFQQYSSSFTDLYLTIQSLHLKLAFQGTPLNSSHFLLESAHSTDFISIIFYLLIGNMFVLFWILPKLRVLLDDQVKFFVLWTISFFMLWVTYQGFTSVRYLSVILVPIIVIVTHGFHKLYQDLTKSKALPLGLGLLGSLLAFASYYYPISPSILLNIDPKSLNQQFLLSAYNYYKNSIFYILFALLSSYIVIITYKWSIQNQIKFKHLKKLPIIYIKAFFIILIVLIPFVVPGFVFISVNGNIDDFNSLYNYYQRPAYKELVSTLLDENSPSSGIIAVDLPGLPIYLNQPEIDLFTQAEEIQPLFNPNVTNMLQLLLNPLNYAKVNYNLSISSEILGNSFSFDYIVIPNYDNNIYNYYATTLYQKSFLFSLLFQKHLFNLIYENNEFLLFKRVFNIPSYSGIINVVLQANQSSSSILGMVQSPMRFSNDTNAEIRATLQILQTTQLSINTTILYKKNGLNSTLQQTVNLTLNPDETDFTFKVPLTELMTGKDQILIQNLEFKFILTTGNSVNIRTYGLYSNTGGLQINYDMEQQNWFIMTGSGLQLTA